MKKYSPEITLIAIGLIFSGLIIAFTVSEKGVIKISTLDNSTEHLVESSSTETSLENASSNHDTEISQYTGPAVATLPINLNTATANEIRDNIPGVGDALANRIVEYREIYGSFSSVDDLLIISGIGEEKLESIRSYVTV